MNTHQLCTLIERRRKGSSRTAAVRAFILGYFRAAASDTGHVRAGHGKLAVTEGADDSSAGRQALNVSFN